MSSCSTAEKGTSALDYVQEELTSTAAGSCSSNVLLNLGPGYTAPPPTPMAAGAAAPDHHSLSSSTGSCSAVPTKFTDDDDPEFVADADEKAHKISTQLAAPTRADLDALAHYLMQQSLLSTPTLRLASPRSQQRKRRSLTCSTSGPPAEVAAIAASTNNIDIYGTSIDEEEEVTNGKRFSIISDEHVDATAAAAPVFSYVCRSTTSMGFPEESRQGISKACQEMGAFYINVASAVQEINFEQSDAEALLRPALRRCSSNIMHVGSGPLVPLSENLIMINPALQASSSSCTCTTLHLSSPQEAEMIAFERLDPQTFPADTNFRETMKKNAKLLFDVSKDVAKLLLEDLCVQTQTNIRGHSLKTLLFVYKNNGKHEKKANDVRHDDDVVLSLSHGILNHKDNKNVLLLAKVGKQLQSWSEGKYKATSIHSLYNVACGEICMQLDLVEHH